MEVVDQSGVHALLFKASDIITHHHGLHGATKYYPSNDTQIVQERVLSTRQGCGRNHAMVQTGIS